MGRGGERSEWAPSRPCLPMRSSPVSFPPESPHPFVHLSLSHNTGHTKAPKEHGSATLFFFFLFIP